MNAILDPGIDHLRQWIGCTQEAEELLTPRVAGLFEAVLGSEQTEKRDGDTGSPGIHWCITQPIAPMSALGQDGHPGRGGFLPPVSLPRRMWAGSALEIKDDIRVGDKVRRISRVEDIVLKEGRSGPLCFVTVAHDFSTHRGIAVRDQQTIVYRGTGEPPAAKTGGVPAGTDSTARETRNADAVLLFRYSAATSNTHRIHYDRRYCTEVENYPGLVVHGPLQGTYLWNLAAKLNGRAPARFEFRGVAPLFDGQHFTLHSDEAEDGTMQLWVANREGTITTKATAGW
ncbi:FAS1-like dehydratase domain-containing protein [Chelativorans sp. YIM 93263]|uniref:FAS1-like dehydratase domain-containing protein n=1 Tax=Chelativorans sp. YIM 93263 TaxID=2906648 RepID=UPI002378946E|nr:MaoC family dehydratase N-terminal domain-containing protein [Chelativorans sp. YIM 93263]